MWLDQDLLKMSEAQRRGAATTATLTAPKKMVSADAYAVAEESQDRTTGFQLKSVAGTESDKGAQAHGYAKGFASGWAAGQRRAAREAAEEQARIEEEARLADEARSEAFADSMDTVALVAQSVGDRDELVVDEMKDALALAAIELAEALLGAELSSSDTGAKAALKRALNIAEAKDIVRVRMNARDIAVLEASGVESPVELVADPAMEPGDAISEMPEGFLDARLSSALQRAKAALEAVREAGGEL
ncbi:MAG: FliH/SctL family protein [Actinomycetaceae bacterium]|nr:FliH/SctL family protein [Actinomycetaceae bacterium]